ncbi:MAG: TlyA family rRNA (cytidine-2'-O)-methyltransferase [Myxococcales bacterium]|nr:TlyA family rRNA (cytidine-2'-O)-methyltransferase [Myxococcales bacterium]
MAKGVRIDRLLVDRGLVQSRERARARIMAGQVFIADQRIDKPGTRVDPDAEIDLRGDKNPFVSRGGLKLDGALNAFELDVTDRVAMDVGASTGGFTDCLLQRGAARVYAVDVGYGQLAWKLRQDERVINLERTNVRALPPGAVPEPIELVVADCSFISLTKVLPPVLPLLAEGAELVILIKPQFEAGRGRVGKGGVVRDEQVRQETIDEVVESCRGLGLEPLGQVDSEVHGPKGNVEHFVWLRRVAAPVGIT